MKKSKKDPQTPFPRVDLESVASVTRGPDGSVAPSGGPPAASRRTGPPVVRPFSHRHHHNKTFHQTKISHQHSETK